MIMILMLILMTMHMQSIFIDMNMLFWPKLIVELFENLFFDVKIMLLAEVQGCLRKHHAELPESA